LGKGEKKQEGAKTKAGMTKGGLNGRKPPPAEKSQRSLTNLQDV